MELNLKIPASNEEIKAEIAALNNQIKQRTTETELLRYAVGHYRKFCKHEGQVTGRNDRDGSWGNPCPTCGYSY